MSWRRCETATLHLEPGGQVEPLKAERPCEARADIAPDRPDRIVDFIDIPWEVDAFRSLPYPFDGPDECP